MRLLGFYAALVAALFAPCAFAQAEEGGLPILVYHEIRTARAEPYNPDITITLDDFKEQMRYLHTHGYKTLSMPEVIDYMKGKPFPEKVIAIHFDDGWKSAKEAVPVLNRYGFKASFWIIAGAGHDEGSPHMDWPEVMKLAENPNFDIYSHTMTHPWKEGHNMVDWVNGKTEGMGEEDAMWELSESKRMLEAHLGKPVPYLAWPSGLYNRELVTMAQEAGYTALLTIDDGVNRPGDNVLYIKRAIMDGRCDMAVFFDVLYDGYARDCDPAHIN